MTKTNKNHIIQGVKVKLGISDKIIRSFGYAVLSLYALACIFPFLLIVGTSFTSETVIRAEEHTSELQSLAYLVCRLLLEKKRAHV